MSFTKQLNFPALLKGLLALNIKVFSSTAMMAHEQLN